MLDGEFGFGFGFFFLIKWIGLIWFSVDIGMDILEKRWM